MGSNSSSHQQHYASFGGLSHEMGRGWTHSFPREIGKQSPRLKVLPEPSNQRLRATNNGSIIHNGGTISGRRPAALTLPHDLNKQGVFRVRSTSASNFMSARPAQNADRPGDHRSSYQDRCDGRDCEMSELKRFGSEPDLRYSPGGERVRQDPRQQQGYSERDARERESRYRGKKKYRAPAPPAGNGDGSSPDSYKWEIVGREREARSSEEIQPPPRRSRLFKTRAETKRAQIGWTSHQEQRGPEGCGKGWQNVRRDRSDRENIAWREQEDRWEKEERKARLLDGKNTLQRSLSSPEFQAELMQVARKVRGKLLNCRREGPVGEATTTRVVNEGSSARIGRDAEIRDDRRIEADRRMTGKRQEDRLEDRKAEKRNARNREECVDGVLREESRVEVKNARNQDELRSLVERRADDERRMVNNNRARDGESLRNRLLKKSMICEEGTDLEDGARCERAEVRGNSQEDNRPLERREYSEDRWRCDSGSRLQNRKLNEVVDVVTRTRSESPVKQGCRDKIDLRGRASGRESTPEPPRSKDSEGSDSRRRGSAVKGNEKRWSESFVVKIEKTGSKAKEKSLRKSDVGDLDEKNWEISPPAGKSSPKTFYFGMDETLTKETRDRTEQQVDRIQARLQSRDLSGSPEGRSIDVNRTNQEASQNGVDNIALKLRPTLPKKQLEIPRFSPSAAWRLLSALESPGPAMSTASEEGPVLFEERIERLSRPPLPLVALGPRSSHDKSGDSGISGDAGAANDDSLDIGMANRTKALARPAWTPQQDLGEESSSDAGVDSPPPMVSTSKFPSRAHVFSLSLPRDTDNRLLSLYNPESKGKQNSSFNSLQKLKRSVSGVLGLGTADLERKQGTGVLDDNWLLSTSAPNSLQHIQSNIEGMDTSSPTWQPSFAVEEDDDDDDDDDGEEEDEDLEDKSDFPMIMKPPSFSYLAAGGHVMYLPESGGSDYRMPSLNHLAENAGLENDRNSNGSGRKREKNTEDIKRSSRYPAGVSANDKCRRDAKGGLSTFRERSLTDSDQTKSRKCSSFSKSCENISEMRQRGGTPSPGPENLQDSKESSSEVKAPLKQSSSRAKRFTFQSTVRQIERRRLAEKLSREAEAKERQRRGELEAMRKVEEEFQRKRAREKANIRQQLRLFSMDENLSSLPPTWETTAQLSRADPDGAPSSSASSPTSAQPAGKLTTIRKNSASSDEYHRKATSTSDWRQQHREYKDYRPRYYDWGPEGSSHVDSKQTTVHPKVVYDIPKSSPVFVDANVHANKATNLNSTPRSDNYRKDFAHGAVAGRSSLASSDSELSQPNTRPHSRQTKSKAHRSRRSERRSKKTLTRSASPARSEDVSSEDECPVESVEQERNPLNGLILNAVQPFVRKKSYRPISFNPRSSLPIPS